MCDLIFRTCMYLHPLDRSQRKPFLNRSGNSRRAAFRKCVNPTRHTWAFTMASPFHFFALIKHLKDENGDYVDSGLGHEIRTMHLCRSQKDPKCSCMSLLRTAHRKKLGFLQNGDYNHFLPSTQFVRLYVYPFPLSFRVYHLTG